MPIACLRRSAVGVMLVMLAACGEQSTAPAILLSKSVRSGANSSTVTVTSTSPSNAPQDTTLDVQVNGSGFDRSSTVAFQINGTVDQRVHVNSTKYSKSTQLIANVTIAADAVPTSYDVAVTTASGLKGIGSEMFTVTLTTAELAFLAPVGSSGATRVVVSNADGTNQATVSSSSGGYPPSWSGSGAGTPQNPWRLVYNTSYSNFTTVNIDTAGARVNLSNPVSFTYGANTLDPRWMPGQDSIVFSTQSALMIVGAGGGTPAVLYQPADTTKHQIYSAWKTDASAIAFVQYSTTGGANFSIRIFNRRTGVVTTAVEPGSLGDIFQLDWARTRDEIAFTVHPAGQANRETWVVALTPDANGNLVPSALPRRLTATAGWPSWSPTDAQLVIAGLYTVDYATGATGSQFSSGGGAPDWRR